ncbi:MAG: FliM/FliN family flagellar motor switch protein [Halieaceae bacterium]|nr:FliM/FliN family flagellar motor switch protein [Halieaceae bacterium]
MSDLLSEDEVDALLTDAEDGAAADADGPLPCDLSLINQRFSGWRKQLSLVDENLTRCLSQRLLGLLHKRTRVAVEGVQTLRFGDYIDSLELPTGLSSFRLEPAGSILMIAMDASLVYSLVESLFGGPGRRVAINSRGFSATEQRVLQLGLDTILEAVRKGWRQLEGQTLNLCESEHNPQASNVFDADDVVMIRRYSISYDGGSGELCMVMCSNLVEALFGSGHVEPEHPGDRRELLRARARDFNATVAGVVSGVELPLRQLLQLSRGDVIPIGSPEIVDVTVNGVKKFTARVGEIDKRVGLSIIHPEEES